MVFDRDALIFSGALTLGELLQNVPGTFLVRAGWFGQPEVVAYAGQGAASVELVWDGYVLDPLGEDSSAIDLSRINLGLLNRVEVEVLPSALRVYLFSDTQEARRARTETSFATGDASTNTYRIRYLNRWRDGSGLGLGVTFFGTDGPSTTRGDVSDLTLWAKGTWTPSELVGVEYQLVRHNLKRAAVEPTSGSLPGLAGSETSRTDAFVRAHFGTEPDGLGLSFDALLGGSTYSDSGTLERRIAQAGAWLSYRGRRWSVEASTRARDVRTPLELRLRAAVSPGGWMTLSGYAARRSHDFGRRSYEAGASAELTPLPWLALYGALRRRDAVASPEILGDTAQRVGDWRAGIAVASLRRRFELDVSLERHGWFAAPPFGVFAGQLQRATTIDVVTMTAAARIRPSDWLTLWGWYRDPLDPIKAAFEPPTHARVAATFRSRLLRVFRRGAFDLLFQVGAEGWGRGVAGLDGEGQEIVLKGAGSVDYLLEFRLLGAVLFWTLRNAQAERYAVVPGFEMARALQRFGVRWEFTN